METAPSGTQEARGVHEGDIQAVDSACPGPQEAGARTADPDAADRSATDPDATDPDATDPDATDLVDAALGASRVLVAVAARSLAGVADDVTLAQFRALVVLATEGPQRVADLAAELAVNASTATRMCDRLVRKSLVTRTRLRSDRRSVRIVLSDVGEALVAEVTARRRAEITRMMDGVPLAGRAELIHALRIFVGAAGETPEQHWSIGWDRDTPGDQRTVAATSG